METRSRIQELAKNSVKENSRNKSHAKISEFTVFNLELPTHIMLGFQNAVGNDQEKAQSE